MSEESILLE